MCRRCACRRGCGRKIGRMGTAHDIQKQCGGVIVPLAAPPAGDLLFAFDGSVSAGRSGRAADARAAGGGRQNPPAVFVIQTRGPLILRDVECCAGGASARACVSAFQSPPIARRYGGSSNRTALPSPNAGRRSSACARRVRIRSSPRWRRSCPAIRKR